MTDLRVSSKNLPLVLQLRSYTLRTYQCPSIRHQARIMTRHLPTCSGSRNPGWGIRQVRSMGTYWDTWFLWNNELLEYFSNRIENIANRNPLEVLFDGKTFESSNCNGWLSNKPRSWWPEGITRLPQVYGRFFFLKMYHIYIYDMYIYI